MPFCLCIGRIVFMYRKKHSFTYCRTQSDSRENSLVLTSTGIQPKLSLLLTGAVHACNTQQRDPMFNLRSECGQQQVQVASNPEPLKPLNSFPIDSISLPEVPAASLLSFFHCLNLNWSIREGEIP